MSNRIIAFATVLLLPIVSGCSHAPLGKNFNEANANNIAVQTVNPNAAKDEVPLHALDGTKAERLLNRYRSDTGKASSEGLVTKVSQ